MIMDVLSPINITLFIFWLGSALGDFLEFVSLWQVKEYRMDRFREFLATRQGRRYWLRYPMFWRSFLAIIVFLMPFNNLLFIKYLIIGIYGLDVASHLFLLLKRRLHRPILTTKATILVLLSLAVEGGLFVLTRDWTILLLLLITRFFITAGLVLLLTYPTLGIKKLAIARATKKLTRYPKLTVIGITGSYAKTTTKEFLAHILSKKFTVIKTHKHTNTEIGVAQMILKTDFSDADIFIVEMGAYREGEIALICDMVQPKIGILTAINEQHAALFGSIENIQKAKYELLRALPKEGIAIVNSDNPYCRAFLHELPCTVRTFGTDPENQPTCLITDIEKTSFGIRCTGTTYGLTGTIDAPIVGKYNGYNISPCFIAARELGMDREEIKNAIRTIPKELSAIQTIPWNKALVLNDSYNSNPTGFKAALDVLHDYPSDRRRIVVTRGMLELGQYSHDIHEEMGGEIAFVADELIVTSPDYYDDFVEGAKGKYHLDTRLVENPEKLLAVLKERSQTPSVILLENRMPALLMNAIQQK